MIVKVDKEEYNYDLKELAKSFGIDIKIETIDLLESHGVSMENFIVLQGDSENKIIGKYYNNFLLEKEIFQSREDFLSEKNIYKRLFYSLLSDITKVSLPWGILTGIRPVKIVHKMLKEQLTRNQIRTSLVKEYYIQEKKADLIIDIAFRQNTLLNKIKDTVAIYISIPFCPSRCNYCSFFSCDIKTESNLVDDYLLSLKYEIQKVFESDYLKDKIITSIYIGGGTPSSINEKQLEFLMNTIDENINKNNILEFTFEGGRPETLNSEKLKILKTFNVTRLSINPQTMNDKTLIKIGRNHTSKDIIDCFNLARKNGFDNINMDIILGLEDETAEELENTLKEIKKLHPESLTVHTLSLKRASKLIESVKKDKTKLNTNDIYMFMSMTEQYAKDMNLHPYYLYRQKNILLNLENIGYSKSSLESFYNIGIMEEKQTILAFGAGAISKFYYEPNDRIERIPNIKDVRLYIKRIDELIEKKLKEVEKWS
ncbi:oxygen-independent coproporphyrinogen-3 oxidase [Acetoanaerobium pronyense]|uniref:Oxygen-independent coproporphyrinogen-3 oxidase n=1 Tax=Acetoanaerobium pronyense TaxID=1482736 RepID=A0ABS4KLZ1_9FIRM|nr:coproporphyrinogen dehydrogenase HemZ [Acetoanaerobium pronyense]MBP2027634.1 oxygen-independent coproporphyrinogen-3 oxidase [Acetoanaerobium pronyense]